MTATGKKKPGRIKLLASFAGLLTVFRIWLAVNTPLFIQGDAMLDDYLLAEYARDLLNGKWLGDYSSTTLVKTISYPLILAFNYILGIPYSYGLIIGYILAVLLMTLALGYFIRNRYALVGIYLFLLYSPVMFHEENVQKVYRGGCIVVCSLLVFAAVTGIYAEVAGDKCRRLRLAGWSLLGVVSLPLFWYLKEDSIWILPFVLGGTLCALIALFIRKPGWKKAVLRSLLILLPLVSLLGAGVAYRGMNEKYYGIAAITDREGTNFRKVIEDIQSIEDDGIGDAWITRRMAKKACDASPSMAVVEDVLCRKLDDVYGEGRDPQGDFFIWFFRASLAEMGYYANGPQWMEDYYGKIHGELQGAFVSGKLKKDKKRIYISSICRGYTVSEMWDYYSGRSGEALGTLITYRENETTRKAATGSDEAISLMAQLTNSKYIRQDPYQKIERQGEVAVSMDQAIVSVYQKTAKPVFLLGASGLLLLFVTVIWKLIKKKADVREIGLALVLLGMITSAAALIFGVMWFANFLSEKKLYDYFCGAIPVMNIAEAVGIYTLFATVATLVNGKLKKNYDF